MARRRRSVFGLPTWVASLLGLGLLFVLFRKGGLAKAKPTSIDQLIVDKLTEAGYYGTQPANWARVARVETADYTSRLYLEDNNLFGMKMPKIRDTTAVSETASGFAKFSSLESSIDDLILYLEYFDYPKSFANLYNQARFMRQKGYFELGLLDYLMLLRGVEFSLPITFEKGVISIETDGADVVEAIVPVEIEPEPQWVTDPLVHPLPTMAELKLRDYTGPGGHQVGSVADPVPSEVYQQEAITIISQAYGGEDPIRRNWRGEPVIQYDPLPYFTLTDGNKFYIKT